MRPFACLAALLALLPVSFLRAAEAPVAPPAPSSIDAELKAIVARHKLPGLAAVALRGDQIVAQGVAGVRLVGAPQPLTLADKFHLGSDTKAMTATLLAQLVEEGKLKWSTTLGEAFGATVKDMDPAWRSVTLQQVLAHRAGLPANPTETLKDRIERLSKSLPEQRLILARAILARPPESPPGTKYLYSNIGFVLGGAIVEQLTGKSWEDAMRERLFKPLQIASGGFGAPATTTKNDQPRGHLPDGSPVPPGADNRAFYGPAGSAHMTIGDWSKFIALHLRGDPANPHAHAELLKPETFAALHRAQPGEDYAFGWGFTTRSWANGHRPGDTGRVFRHAGSNTNWFCITWVAPEIDFAVLMVCNQAGDEATKACDEAAGVLLKKAGVLKN